MSLKRIGIAIAAFIIMGAMGCAGTPHLDSNWGRSFETAKYLQTLNPDAGKAITPQR